VSRPFSLGDNNDAAAAAAGDDDADAFKTLCVISQKNVQCVVKNYAQAKRTYVANVAWNENVLRLHLNEYSDCRSQIIPITSMTDLTVHISWFQRFTDMTAENWCLRCV